MTGTQNGLPVAPSQRGRKKSRHGRILGIRVTVRNAERIGLEKIRTLKPVGRLVEPLLPLREAGGGGAAAKGHV